MIQIDKEQITKIYKGLYNDDCPFILSVNKDASFRVEWLGRAPIQNREAEDEIYDYYYEFIKQEL